MTEAILQEKVLKLFKEASNTADPASDEKFPRLRASQFMSRDFLPPHDIDLPSGYFLWEKGLYKASVGEDKDESIEIKKLTRVPFFVAVKEEFGRVLILRFLNRTWLYEWIQAKKVAQKSTYLEMLIFPEKEVTFTDLVNYTFECAVEAPFTDVLDPSINDVMKEIRNKYGVDKSKDYPFRVDVSEIKEICELFEVSYMDIRRRLVSTGTINELSHIKRNNKNKPARHLVFNKAIKILNEDQIL